MNASRQAISLPCLAFRHDPAARAENWETFALGIRSSAIYPRGPMQKNALGKGLGALISGAARRSVAVQADGEEAVAEAPSAAGERVVRVPLTSIRSSPMQPRKQFQDELLTELMESIREHGVIQPLVVRRVNDTLELIAGERRFRACQKLGLTEVPVIEREASDRDVLEMALIENLQREDLNPIEEAEAYSRLAREFGMRQEDIAQRVGKNRATVANSMRLLDLAPDVKNLLAQGRLSTGHAKAILSLRDAGLQSAVAARVIRQNLTVRETERLVQREATGTPSSRSSSQTDPDKSVALAAALRDLQNRLRDHLATSVSITHSGKKGRIEIEYYGTEDLNRILDAMGVPNEG